LRGSGGSGLEVGNPVWGHMPAKRGGGMGSEIYSKKTTAYADIAYTS